MQSSITREIFVIGNLVTQWGIATDRDHERAEECLHGDDTVFVAFGVFKADVGFGKAHEK